MTLDEAIKNAEKIAEENQRIVDTGILFEDVTIDMFYCDDTEVIEEHLANYQRCAEKHRQLAEWLKELKQLREQTRWIPVSESKRLPKGSDIVLLSLPPHIDPDGEECSASVICGHYIGGKNKEWGLSDGDTFGYGIVSVRKGTNPIAWMPSPKPYEPHESEIEE